jgi:hypothetical protein
VLLSVEGHAERRAEAPFRPKRLLTSVRERGVAVITRIAVGNVEQLLEPVDAYEWSLAKRDRIERELMQAYGLKTREELEDLFDDRGWSLLDPGRVDLPTLSTGMALRLEWKLLRPEVSEVDRMLYVHGVELEP